ncbi:MAG TPA: hypothetical protein PLG67_00785 [Bacillota bacterium]|nr:hypothetical protein [Sedimentibacter sp.]HQL35109.1 hypothetical protein [Bacillota bacterium]
MDQVETLVLRSTGSYKLLKISTGEIYYIVDISGKKSTQHFNDYEDATDAFNLCVLEEQFGER